MLKQAGVQVLQGRAKKLNMDEKVLTYVAKDSIEKQIKYDYAVIATGVQRAWPVAPRELDKTAYLEDVRRHVDRLEAAETVAIIGGGEFILEQR